MMMGIREYARHCRRTHGAVRKAIATKRIEIDPASGKIDSDAADKAWPTNTDPAKCHTLHIPAPAPLPLIDGAATGQVPAAAARDRFRAEWPADLVATPLPPKAGPRMQAPLVSMDTYLAAKTERERAHAELVKMQVLEKQGHLISAEGARQAYWSMGKILRAAHEGIPTPLSIQLVGKTDPVEIAAIVRISLRELLERAYEEIESRFAAVISNEADNLSRLSALG